MPAIFCHLFIHLMLLSLPQSYDIYKKNVTSAGIKMPGNERVRHVPAFSSGAALSPHIRVEELTGGSVSIGLSRRFHPSAYL